MGSGTDSGFQVKEARDKRKNKKNSNTHPYGIKKLSTKTNIQKSLFVSILKCNRLPTKTKDTKYYYFLIHKILLFF